MSQLEAHPYANDYPMMSEDEHKQLVESIKNKGQQDLIVIYEGKILDGRNRYKACREIGIAPKLKGYIGSDPLGYVTTKNLHRRHLTDSQRAEIALKIAERLTDEENKKNAAEKPEPKPSETKKTKPNASPANIKKAAAKMSISPQTVDKIKKIKEKAPEKIDEIKSGKKTINKVFEEIKKAEVKEKPETTNQLTADEMLARETAINAAKNALEFFNNDCPVGNPWRWDALEALIKGANKEIRNLEKEQE